ncbi:MAG: putative periplasmic subtsrate-binding protein [Xanthobacteraceae bacterium]|nr:putative periplasmic subtsrate-binding protein [Xanthobacteraceae bacterium]
MKDKFHCVVLAAAALLSPMLSTAPRAEVTELRMATQFGIGAMPMIVMERQKLLEKHLASAGLPAVKVTWRQFPGGNPMNEGLLSGSLDIVSGGTTVFLTLWAKAKGTSSAVKGVGAVSALPLYLLTRNPNVQKIEDLGDQDRIAVTTLKVSVHAILLQMAAEKVWGPGNNGRLDRLVVQIPHGDAAAAMMSGASEINNHFTAPPFQDIELKKPGIRRILSAQDIFGAPATYMIAYTTEKFRKDNPKIYQAFVDALKEVHELINKDPAAIAKIYLEQSKDPITVDEAVAIIKDPGSTFNMTPLNVTKFATFMAKQGITKVTPTSWQEMFFPEVHDQPGS